jgi:hypothetical protein
MKLPRTWNNYLWSQGDSYIFASSAQNRTDVVTFACEAKYSQLAAAQRQLTFDLCSAQHQRRALGFKNGRVYGATVVRDSLKIHCSKWEISEENETVVRIIIPFFKLSRF